MNMHQKREMRAEKKKEDNQKSLPSTSINWVMLFYGNTIKNVDISSLF